MLSNIMKQLNDRLNRGTSIFTMVMTVTAMTLVGGCGGPRPHDWPQFRGPDRNGRSEAVGLLSEWPEGGPSLVWKGRGMGSGYSSVALAGGLAITQGHHEGREWIVAARCSDGGEAWRTDAGAAREVGVPGARSTPTIDGRQVFIETVKGEVACLNLADGEIIWQRDLIADFKGRPGGFGYCESPLVDGQQVIVTPGGMDATMVALDRLDGRTIWVGLAPQKDAAAYASPIMAVVDGLSQYVQLTKSGVVSFAADDGRFLWREDSSANPSANCSAPVFHDGYVFSSSEYGQGAALVKLARDGDNVSAELVYFTDQFQNKHGGFVVAGDHVYGTSGGTLTCLDLKTGKVVWQDGSVGRGSIVYADGHLYLRGDSGLTVLVEATPDGYREKGRFQTPDRGEDAAWAYPAIARGMLYMRDQDVLHCFDVRQGDSR